jgi:hypothetical protein
MHLTWQVVRILRRRSTVGVDPISFTCAAVTHTAALHAGIISNWRRFECCSYVVRFPLSRRSFFGFALLRSHALLSEYNRAPGTALQAN